MCTSESSALEADETPAVIHPEELRLLFILEGLPQLAHIKRRAFSHRETLLSQESGHNPIRRRTHLWYSEQPKTCSPSLRPCTGHHQPV